MIEVLPALILAALIVIAAHVRTLGREVTLWRERWGQIPVPPSSHQNEETLKAAQEAAHYLALWHRDRREAGQAPDHPHIFNATKSDIRQSMALKHDPHADVFVAGVNASIARTRMRTSTR